MYQFSTSTIFQPTVDPLPCTDALEIREVPGKGRGVFAKRHFEAGELIERCPVIVLPAHEEPKHGSEMLYHYVFEWPDFSCAVALGFGSLYNHSYKPNAYYLKNTETKTIDFIAFRTIEAGDEIMTNYNKDPHSQAPLWFDDV